MSHAVYLREFIIKTASNSRMTNEKNYNHSKCVSEFQGLLTRGAVLTSSKAEKFKA